MPRKTKEQKKLENDIKKPKKSSSTKQTSSVKKEKSVTSKSSSATKKAVTSKKTKSNTPRKATTKKTTAKKTATTNKNTTTVKKSSTKKSTTKSEKKKVEIVEYYDLPYRYNQTLVKVLAQTPTNLFIYWDISDEDKKKFQKQYGENFFETTKPILIVHNDTLGYSFEVEINDFANSWYLHVADSKCDYRIELGRRPFIKSEKLNIDYIHIYTSNGIESPNNKILFDKNQKMVYFKNIKTGLETEKSIQTLSFITNMGKIYDIYDLYKGIYQNENIEEIYDLSNPSS